MAWSVSVCHNMNNLKTTLLYAAGYNTAVAGYHDGLHQRVDYSRRDSHYIEKHEGLHDSIFFRTADGMLHIAALHVSRDLFAPLSDEERSRLVALVDSITEDTRWAHESAATYLGVKDCGSDHVRDVALAEMNNTYLHYYTVFQQVIDSDVNSLFAQYAVGWALTYFAFSSKRVEVVEDWGRLTWDDLRQVPGPDQRLSAAINEIGKHPGFFARVLKDVRTILQDNGVTWSSLDDDDVWWSKHFEAQDERNAVDQFLIKFALSRIVDLMSGDIIDAEFRTVPALGQAIERYQIREHFRTSVGSELMNAMVSEEQVLDMAYAADRHLRTGSQVPLEEFDLDTVDRIFELDDFADRIFTIGGWKDESDFEEIWVLCYRRDDVYGELDPTVSGQIERRLLPHLFSALSAKMMQKKISYPIMVVENDGAFSNSTRTGSWILGDRMPEFFQLLSFSRAEASISEELPITLCISLFRYCTNNWADTLCRLDGNIAQIGSAFDPTGFIELEEGIYQNDPKQEPSISDKTFTATLFYHNQTHATYFRIVELSTYDLYQPLILQQEERGRITREISATAREEKAAIMRYAIFTARDLFPVL